MLRRFYSEIGEVISCGEAKPDLCFPICFFVPVSDFPFTAFSTRPTLLLVSLLAPQRPLSINGYVVVDEFKLNIVAVEGLH